nr:hypothetical protein KPHV_26930 [Kitasatospora purpeofusca]
MARRGAMQNNRYGGGCAKCSVWVFEGGGFLHKTDGGWVVKCATCRDLGALYESEEFDPADIGLHLPTVRSPLTARFVSLRVLGLTRECWKCHRDTTCLAGLYPERPARGFNSLHMGDEDTLALTQKLLQQGGRSDLAATIKSRYSSTMGSRYLSVGCVHCDALQGDFYLQDEVIERLHLHGLGGLENLLVVDCPVLDWYPVVHQNSGGIWIDS